MLNVMTMLKRAVTFPWPALNLAKNRQRFIPTASLVQATMSVLCVALFITCAVVVVAVLMWIMCRWNSFTTGETITYSVTYTQHALAVAPPAHIFLADPAREVAFNPDPGTSSTPVIPEPGNETQFWPPHYSTQVEVFV